MRKKTEKVVWFANEYNEIQKLKRIHLANDDDILKTSFGLDIAGYSTGKSGFARARRKSDNSIIVTVYQGHVFSKKYDGKLSLDSVETRERELLQACCKNSVLLVDTPIDLQGLPNFDDASFIWQLTRRPVDYSFGGMAPFANYIGAPVARFQNLLSASDDLESFESLVGTQIFETYPAASLRLLGLPYKKYKDHKIVFEDGHWTGGIAEKIAEGLELIAENGEMLNNDELDAIICALTGIVDNDQILQNDELKHEISKGIISKLKIEDLNGINVEPPLGYVLLKERPKMKINIEIKKFDNHKSMMDALFS